MFIFSIYCPKARFLDFDKSALKNNNVNSFGVSNYIILMWWEKSAKPHFHNSNKNKRVKVKLWLFQIKKGIYVLHFLSWVSFCWFSDFFWRENTISGHRLFCLNKQQGKQFPCLEVNCRNVLSKICNDTFFMVITSNVKSHKESYRRCCIFCWVFRYVDFQRFGGLKTRFLYIEHFAKSNNLVENFHVWMLVIMLWYV